MNEELDSQLSAMFDDELPAGECELLARRLSRDELLKARWGRYAVVGAVIRAERGVRLNATLAGRVNAALSAEPELGSGPGAVPEPRGGMRWWQPVAGGALAASVAAAAVLWLRTEAPAGSLTAQRTGAAAPAAALTAVNLTPSAANSYVTPAAPKVRPMVAPSTQLANYVVAHSMFSSPVARRNLLSSFITAEQPTPGTEEPQDELRSAAH
jgi:negative regulator of sigma E activity